ncbi:MAG: hypothetical protein ACMXYC_04835 [Candidatus Woesearchaeota archaeon]
MTLDSLTTLINHLLSKESELLRYPSWLLPGISLESITMDLPVGKVNECLRTINPDFYKSTRFECYQDIADFYQQVPHWTDLPATAKDYYRCLAILQVYNFSTEVLNESPYITTRTINPNPQPHRSTCLLDENDTPPINVQPSPKIKLPTQPAKKNTPGKDLYRLVDKHVSDGLQGILMKSPHVKTEAQAKRIIGTILVGTYDFSRDSLHILTSLEEEMQLSDRYPDIYKRLMNT